GIIALIHLEQVLPDDLAADPAVRLTMNHINAHAPLAPGQHIGFIRFAMGNQTYRNPSTPMSVSVLGARSAYAQASLAWSNMVVSEPEFWRDHFAYVNHHPLPGGTYELGERTFTIFSHDWRKEPIDRFDEILTRREMSTSLQLEPAGRPPDPIVVLSRTEFDESVRRALRSGLVPARLHDNPLLRSHLVVRGRNGEPAPEFLCAAIREAAMALQTNARTTRYYRVIDRTYLNPAATQEQAAEQLDLPFSTYRRHLTTGITLLTEELWHRELRAGAAASPG
ncbi:MAG TPA: hypothetical protein VD767_03990, partial [Thermomicrobiales bacterium]|nr:hypothetical protein [Thermomicrobiales bacterium]